MAEQVAEQAQKQMAEQAEQEEKMMDVTAAQGLLVRDVLPLEPHVLVEISPEATVGDALKVLGGRTFLSLPLHDEKKVFDMLDVALLITAMFATNPKFDRGTIEKFTKMPVADAVKSCVDFRLSENPSFDPSGTIDPSAPLAELLSMMWGGWHRVLAGNQLVAQSDVVKFMALNMPLLMSQDVAKTPIKELLTLSTKVHTAKTTDTTLAAVSKLARAGVSALPIVDENTGKLVAAFSASDLRFLKAENFHDLQLNVIEFLGKTNQRSRPLLKVDANTTKDTAYLNIGIPQTCLPTDAFDHVLFKLLALDVHRLFVVGDNPEAPPIGVVSYGDLMKIFLLGPPR